MTGGSTCCCVRCKALVAPNAELGSKDSWGGADETLRKADEKVIKSMPIVEIARVTGKKLVAHSEATFKRIWAEIDETEEKLAAEAAAEEEERKRKRIDQKEREGQDEGNSNPVVKRDSITWCLKRRKLPPAIQFVGNGAPTFEFNHVSGCFVLALKNGSYICPQIQIAFPPSSDSTSNKLATYTVILEVCLPRLPSVQQVLFKTGPLSDENAAEIKCNSRGGVGLEIFTEFPHVLEDGKLHHVAFSVNTTRKTSEVSVYVGGEQACVIPLEGAPSAALSLNLEKGCSVFAARRPEDIGDAQISRFAFYNRSLDAKEVKTLSRNLLESSLWNCVSCTGVHPVGVPRCPFCGNGTRPEALLTLNRLWSCLECFAVNPVEAPSCKVAKCGKGKRPAGLCEQYEDVEEENEELETLRQIRGGTVTLAEYQEAVKTLQKFMRESREEFADQDRIMNLLDILNGAEHLEREYRGAPGSDSDSSDDGGYLF
eukprot:gb/GEZN01004215.1/.p1 GENE.gb/GEZN01004215.1/~~gb/GEZN01004215.1/.p1  ORF type:complete len:485 (-),score=56.97 gb/GEZN01004215.1/:273-1727(-)